MALSKSLYINGMQCPKLLWLSKHRKGDGSVFAPNASWRLFLSVEMKLVI